MGAPPNRLWNRDFLLLWQGQLVSQLGTQAFAIATVFWIKRQTDSATLLGLATLASTLPAALLGPLGGAFADRYPRRAILVASDLARGAVSLALAALLFAAPERAGLILPALFAASCAMGIADALFRPAIQAAIPDLVPESRVAGANAANRMALEAATFFGQGVGGVLFRLLGPAVLFLGDGLSYLFAGASEWFVRLPPPERPRGATLRGALAGFRRDVREGLRHVWGRKGLRWLLLLTPLDGFFFMAIVVLLPFYVEDVLRRPPDWYGFLAAAFGAGSLAGSLLAGTVPVAGRRRVWVYLGFGFGFGAAACGLALARSAWVALGLVFVAALMNGFNLIQVISAMQLTTPGRLRGRVFGLFETLALGMVPLAAGTAGLVADLLDRNVRLVYLGCGIALGLVTLALAAIPEVRAFLAHGPEADPPASS